MTTQKPKPPRKLLSETVVELKTDYPTAVERLRGLSEFTREHPAGEREMVFECNKQGRFQLIHNGRGDRYDRGPHRAVRAKGCLYVEEGKTKAVLYVYLSNGALTAVIATVIADVIATLYCGVLFATAWEQGLPPMAVILLLLCLGVTVVAVVNLLTRYGNASRHPERDAEWMTREFLNRLQAVDDWKK